MIKERLNAPTFPWQDEDEPSLLLRKRHWFVFVRSLFIPLITLLLLTILVQLLRWLNVTLSLPLTLLTVGALPSIMTLWLFVDWQNDFYLVTTKRIIHREKIILIYETWDEAPLAKIQDINITYGFIGRILGFGTMHVQTASARGTIVLDYLPDPQGMQEVIFKQVRYLKLRSQQEEREAIRQELAQQLEGTEPDEEELPAITPQPSEELENKGSFLTRLLSPRLTLRQHNKQANQVVWRKHWIFLIKRIYLALPTVLLFSALVIIGLYYQPSHYSTPLLLASLVLWIAGVIWLWWEVEDWRNDVYIVTDRLIIDIEKKPLFFAEERRQATLDMIQNVSLRIPGPLAAILNYGDVLIQTAGPAGTFSFKGISHPTEVQREIFRRVEAYNEARRRREKEQRQAELSAWFQAYHDLSQQQKPSGST